MQKLSRAFLGNRMSHPDDIWYVGRARAEGAHAEFWAWHMLVPWDRRGKKCSTMLYDYQTWSEEPLMQAEDDGNLHGGQRPSKVKCGKLCAMATIFGQKNRQYKLKMRMTFMEVKGHHRSNVVNNVPWLPYLVQRTADVSSE